MLPCIFALMVSPEEPSRRMVSGASVRYPDAAWITGRLDFSAFSGSRAFALAGGPVAVAGRHDSSPLVHKR
jgi:hypothetical protein